MGGVNTKQREEAKRHAFIEQTLLRTQKNDRREIRALLLGAQNSGRFTFLSQFRRLEGNGELFTQPETVAQFICKCIVAQIQSMLYLCNKSVNAEVEDAVGYLNKLDRREITYIDSDILEAIKCAWNLGGLDLKYEYFRCNIEYYIDNLDRITEQGEGYVPTVEDILHFKCPKPPTLHIKVRKHMNLFYIRDCSSISKWAPYFEDANAILYFASLSRQLSGTLGEEDYRAWKEVATYGDLLRVDKLLFFTKTDIFRKVLRIRPFQTTDNDDFVDTFTEGMSAQEFETYFETVKEYVQGKFENVVEDRYYNSTIYTMFISSVDEDNVEKIIRHTMDMIIRTTIYSGPFWC